MTIVYSERFIEQFQQIWDYISKDSYRAAERFRVQAEKRLSGLSYFPYKFRRSRYYDRENIRDYVYKGYTIPYLIDMDKNEIVIMDIFKWEGR